ncbi:MAG: hypothetical protein GWN18_20405 [Thermoplasmata archaeon]|nr:hypothetical protein [Thermoplasmata archaeon]NIS14484.1 hypothetical protein [Thermoplasmata archaeon]NIS22336.1 hypothetical protein [Thermoplasmata archaeon]NIT80214.1 hypothetical protein [Thermoplasmata archaeon]NIU51341.1 hypothetical protein [Thermoplasmata archaeon]
MKRQLAESPTCHSSASLYILRTSSASSLYPSILESISRTSWRAVSPVDRVPIRVMNRCMSRSMAFPLRSHSTMGQSRVTTVRKTGKVSTRRPRNHQLMSGISHQRMTTVNRDMKKTMRTRVTTNS